MIGLDTNILVRYLVQDDPVQARRAAALIDELTEDRPGFVSVVAMAEIVWVLRRGYGFDDLAIASAVEHILLTEVLVVECEQEVFAAMCAAREDAASFPDVLIASLGERAGCSHSLTFDRQAVARIRAFELLH